MTQQATVKIVFVDQDKGPEVREVPDTLESMQSLVKGYVQFVPYRDGVELVCNEEGLLRGMPFNRFVGPHAVHGPFFFTRTDPDEGVSVNLTETDTKLLLEEFALELEG